MTRERRLLIWIAVLAVFVFFIACFIFADQIFNILVVPYEQAAGENTERYEG